MDNLNVYSMSDREVLFIIEDEKGKDGYTLTEDIADRCGLTGDHKTMPVARRLSWMRTWKLVQHHPDKRNRWKLTANGRSLMDGDINSALASMLEGIDPAEVVTVTNFMARRFRRLGTSAATMQRREWQRHTTKPPNR